MSEFEKQVLECDNLEDMEVPLALNKQHGKNAEVWDIEIYDSKKSILIIYIFYNMLNLYISILTEHSKLLFGLLLEFRSKNLKILNMKPN